MAAYSGTPLLRKLGLKAGMKYLVLEAPAHYWELLGPLPEAVHAASPEEEELHFIHLFARDRAILCFYLDALKAKLLPDGMLWISWYKKAAKMDSDLHESEVRRAGLEAGLVDVKICAVDEKWSGLKFVYLLKDRP